MVPKGVPKGVHKEVPREVPKGVPEGVPEGLSVCASLVANSARRFGPCWPSRLPPEKQNVFKILFLKNYSKTYVSEIILKTNVFFQEISGDGHQARRALATF